ncbi:putative thioesterase [Mycobacteroides abscessus subsp. abscessus]|uniref:acyl-CoA thioesterase n=1 Tax=Mycobacteroides abscessus TaxID=36809 RepID=UPI0009C50C39|nr:thioesterase family protein [Mycobacteroides abscessus]SKU32200.1 putative thioesterase [Mycobacteroides abscessus subsp. abscessus]SKX80429.1 putative thioesterase [Mycobacteroides abscessus subsp. abscessus]
MIHTQPIQVRRTDIDAYGHVNNVVLAHYLEESRTEFLSPLAAGTPVVTSQKITFETPLAFCDGPVTVFAHVAEVGATSFELVQSIRSVARTYVHAATTIVAIRAERPTPLLPADRAFLHLHRRGP